MVFTLGLVLSNASVFFEEFSGCHCAPEVCRFLERFFLRVFHWGGGLYVKCVLERLIENSLTWSMRGWLEPCARDVS